MKTESRFFSTQIKAAAALAVVVLLASCKIQRVKIDYTVIGNQLDIESEKYFKATSRALPGGGEKCVNVFRANIQYCLQKKGTVESILEPNLAFTGGCEGEPIGHQQFVIFEVVRDGNPGNNTYHLLSCYLPCDPEAGGLESYGPAASPLKTEIALGGAVLYSGGIEREGEDGRLIVRMRRESSYSNQRFHFFGAQNARPRNGSKADFELFLRKEKQGDNVRITAIDKLIKYQNNVISGTKPLVFELSETLNVEAIKFEEEPVYNQCGSGRLGTIVTPEGEGRPSARRASRRH